MAHGEGRCGKHRCRRQCGGNRQLCGSERALQGMSLPPGSENASVPIRPSPFAPFDTPFGTIRLRTTERSPGDSIRLVQPDDLQAQEQPYSSWAEVEKVLEAFTPPETAIDEGGVRSEEHTSELQSLRHLVCR